MAKSLSLVQRESFFDDSFFKEAWEDFDKAVQQILDKFDSKGLQVDIASRPSCHELYRKIRSSKIDEDIYASQALQVTEKDGKFQCVMDVKDFNPNELQVKVVDDRVVVDGKYEKKSNDGSSMSFKSFHKEFTLPPVADIDAVATALSKDGILTIKAPKKETAVEAAKSGGPVVSSMSSALQESTSSVEKSSSATSSQTVEKSASSSVQQTASSSVQQVSASSAKEMASSSVQKSSMATSQTVQQSFSSSSSSSFSSSSKSVKTSSSSISSSMVGDSRMEELGDLSKDMQDRLVFTHESVNLKLPENK